MGVRARCKNHGIGNVGGETEAIDGCCREACVVCAASRLLTRSSIFGSGLRILAEANRGIGGSINAAMLKIAGIGTCNGGKISS